MLVKSQRTRVPYRTSFLQKRSGSKVTSGPLAELARRHDSNALNLYLLAVAVASHEPFQANFEASVWARALDLRGPAARATISRAWARLEKLGLIRRGRGRSRMVSITLLQEDGSGAAYSRPQSREDRYFQLPVEYWTSSWYRNLSFPAKLMLLLAADLDRGDGFTLPAEKASAWYGISADTAERGLLKLRQLELMQRKPELKPAPLVGRRNGMDGYIRVYRHMLKPPFDRASRRPRRTTLERKGVRVEVVS